MSSESKVDSSLGTSVEHPQDVPNAEAGSKAGTILLVDDYPIFRDGLRQAIAQHSHLVVVGDAATGADALALEAKLAPDLTLMEAVLPDLSGLAVTQEILKTRPVAKVIILSSSTSRHLVDEALRAGASGFVWKRALSGDLIRATEIVMAGGLYVSPELCTGLLEDYRRRVLDGHEVVKPLLSKREKELLRLVAEGQRNKEIAALLAISPKSVEAYRSRLMKKLGCRGSAELVRLAVREGIVSA